MKITPRTIVTFKTRDLKAEKIKKELEEIEKIGTACVELRIEIEDYECMQKEEW